MAGSFDAFYQTMVDAEIREHVPPFVLEKYSVEDCLVLEESKSLFYLRRKKDGMRGVLRITKAGQDAMEQAATEAEILKELDHPAIPRLMDHWKEEGKDYLVRQYFEGETLEKLILQDGTYPLDKILDIALQICDILTYIHTRSPMVIHRDLKPENIIITRAGLVRIIDFGIARSYDEEAEEDTVAAGTRPYMAPEQFGSGQTSASADIFSLGVVMIFMGTGRPDKEKYRRSLHNVGLSRIIKKCIQYNPKHRYQTAADLRKRLAWLQRRGTKKALLASAVAVGLGLACLGGFVLGNSRGYRQGIEWMMSTPGATPPAYSQQDMLTEVVIDNFTLDLAVRSALSKEQNTPLYLQDIYYRVDSLLVESSHVRPLSLGRGVLREYVGKDDVVYYTSGMIFRADRGDITSLANLARMHNLRTVILTSQQISDLSPISHLGLTELDLRDNFIGSLLPLKDMVTLESLYLGENPFSNIEPLTNLLSLKRLDLSQTQVSDLNPLRNMTKLQTLDIHFIEATDLSTIGNMKALVHLGMRGITPKSYAFLRQLGDLRELDVAYSGLESLDTLVDNIAAREGLQSLDISHTGVKSLSGMAFFPGITSLSLSGTEVTSLQGIEGLANLQTLDISGTSIADLRPLAGLSNLKTLNISNTLVKDLDPLFDRETFLVITAEGLPEDVKKQASGESNVYVQDAY